MKTILGLDLGVSSIGWALVKEAEDTTERSSIIKLGVRVNPITVDEKKNFEEGKSITTTADRTLKRGMRRNLQRFKLRRDFLIECLKEHNFINENSALCEDGRYSTYETLFLREKAVSQKITLEQLSRVLLSINKKRGYKSNRKADSGEDGVAIDSMDVARELYDRKMTPGEYVFSLFQKGKYSVPDFYRSDLINEFRIIWTFQKQFYNELLTDELYESLIGKNKGQTWKICSTEWSLEGQKQQLKGKEAMVERYGWRVESLNSKISLEQLMIVLQDINGQLNSSSGYLGKISDRSKILYMENITVGQYLARQIHSNPHFSTKNIVFYRQDYLDEFEKIWECQAQFHKELTPELKSEIRDVIIFYQRPLKSQKGLVNICEFERKEIEITVDGKQHKKTIGPKVCPKSSPFFQEFRIWQILNNLKVNGAVLSMDEKNYLYKELSFKDRLSSKDISNMILGTKNKLAKINFKEVVGNRTVSKLLQAINTIYTIETGEEIDFSSLSSQQIEDRLSTAFPESDFMNLLSFDSSAEGQDVEKQSLYRMWHLLYSYVGDNSRTGDDGIIDAISKITNLKREYAKIIAKTTFEPDYGNLSVKAIRKILPFMKEGKEYSLACEYAGYRHSKASLTKDELASRELVDRLPELPKNTLRNPVVEKILNQMVNVVNSIADEYGKPDEIRIEMARDLKKCAKERSETVSAINKATLENKRIEEILLKDFGLQYVSKNDILRYRLWKELEPCGYHTLYSNTYIPYEKILTKEFEIEHIIPQALLFDDSFSNKTLETSDVNRKKSNNTALDFVKIEYGEKELENYRSRIDLCKGLSKTKRAHLLMSRDDVPSDFLNRDLRDSQYIAKAAKTMLEQMIRTVTTTTGSITQRLREDWQLVNVMQELNWNKYDKLGLTYYETNNDGKTLPKIKDWTKRNDNRHHAMDALTIAFTKRSFIQYLNNLNARLDKTVDDNKKGSLSDFELQDLQKSERAFVVRQIEKSQMYRDVNGKLKFNPPIPLDEFRSEAKRQLENILVSIKAKNKVSTRNVNIVKTKDGLIKKTQLTPRGQLHNETVYGRIERYAVKEEKIGPSFSLDKVQKVTKKKYREALLNRLTQFDNNPKLAFGGKNALQKNPIWLNELHTASVPEKVRVRQENEEMFTIRKPIDKSLKIEKVVDEGVKRILEARLAEYDGEAAKAFSNLEENPIWLNKEKGITLKSVSIKGVNNAVALHQKRDKSGELIKVDGQPVPSDYVSTSNNHHIAIFKDENGHYQEQPVSFFEANARQSLGIPVIDKDFNKDKGWTFMFTMKQNEYFVLPDAETGFYPLEIDLMDPNNYSIVSPHLFRVQRISTKYYVFRHHLETTVDENNDLRGITWERIQNLEKLKGFIKVRVDNIGRIVAIGEY